MLCYNSNWNLFPMNAFACDFDICDMFGRTKYYPYSDCMCVVVN